MSRRCGVSGVAPDPLDQIEKTARLTAEAWGKNAYARDVLALIEIARAARELLESRLWKSGDGSESWQKANNLAAVLARLDKDTT